MENREAMESNEGDRPQPEEARIGELRGTARPTAAMRLVREEMRASLQTVNNGGARWRYCCSRPCWEAQQGNRCRVLDGKGYDGTLPGHAWPPLYEGCACYLEPVLPGDDLPAFQPKERA